jgi:hypothetical protein
MGQWEGIWVVPGPGFGSLWAYLQLKRRFRARCRWLTSVILAIREAGSQPGQIDLISRPYLKKPYQKNWAGGVAQGEGPEFKPPYRKKKRKENVGSQVQYVK